MKTLTGILATATLAATLAVPARSLPFGDGWQPQIPCAATPEGCGSEPSVDPQPPQPPGPQPPGPGPSNTVDLLPALLMNFEGVGGQIHMEGWWNCPAGYDPDWCPTQFDGVKRRGAFHKYYIRANPRAGCDDEIVFTKSPWGGGMEVHCVNSDRVSILEEELDWNRTGRWRWFVDDLNRPGSIWVRRGVRPDKFFAEGGHQYFTTCQAPETVTLDTLLSSTWALYGPWAINTPEGRAAAESALAKYTPPGYPAIESEWFTFNTRVPGGKATDNVYLYLRPDGWGLKPGRMVGSTNPLDYWMTEEYLYIATGPSLEPARRGLGMIKWLARRNNDDGTSTYLRQVVFDKVVKENQPNLQYGVCKAQGNAAMSQAERRAGRAYDFGDLPSDTDGMFDP